ncbi:hypothetical protein MRBBS_2237 [Marinobacter sp. BSs20148]|jgi:hypothetical protein|nr:hypothetical protein MRBBS_2237 [Marinobacter sp. BSs20148]
MISDIDQSGNIAALSEVSDDQKTTFFSLEFKRKAAGLMVN